MNKDTLSREELRHALQVKAEVRDSVSDLENYSKHLQDIASSSEITNIWKAYAENYPYAKGIALQDIISHVSWVFGEGVI
jgi:hypothetical protein